MVGHPVADPDLPREERPEGTRRRPAVDGIVEEGDDEDVMTPSIAKFTRRAK